jgi:hypothetical protein
METTKRECSMFGCGEASYRPFSIAPATVVDLCLEHFVAEGGVVDEEDSDVAAESASKGS